jgi:hypothetical protein
MIERKWGKDQKLTKNDLFEKDFEGTAIFWLL